MGLGSPKHARSIGGSKNSGSDHEVPSIERTTPCSLGTDPPVTSFVVRDGGSSMLPKFSWFTKPIRVPSWARLIRIPVL